MTDATDGWNLDRYADRGRWRRRLLLLLLLATAGLGGGLMWTVVGTGDMSALQWALLAVFIPIFAWSALSFWCGAFGFILGVLRFHPAFTSPLNDCRYEVSESYKSWYAGGTVDGVCPAAGSSPTRSPHSQCL